MRPTHLGAALIVVVGLVCAGSAFARQQVVVRITPSVSFEDQAVHVAVSGLHPREAAAVTLRSTDAEGTPWVASASFRADGSGRIDLGRARTLSGSYRGVWGMGLVAAMRPTKRSASGAYAWGSRSQAFTITLRAHGSTVASTRFHRKLGPYALRHVPDTLQANGFVGDYWAPIGLTKRPAVLVFGGSEGGEFTYFLGELLASHGYPALSLAYFKEPGLPQTLANIPLEYFAKALTWLDTQPEVDPSKTVVSGASRGSEAALLLGVHFPHLVHGVIASVPSSVSLCSLPNCDGPAWTLNGKALPFSREVDIPDPNDDPAAVIPVEQIQGPVFLDCAVDDAIWSSCLYANAITKRLEAAHVSYAHENHVLRNAAGHYIGALVPYEPGYLYDDPSTERGREMLWPHLMAFLGRL